LPLNYFYQIYPALPIILCSFHSKILAGPNNNCYLDFNAPKTVVWDYYCTQEFGQRDNLSCDLEPTNMDNTFMGYDVDRGEDYPAYDSSGF